VTTHPILLIKPADGGLIYAETNLHHLFPEPLNTLTSCLFFILAIYWIAKLKLYSKRHAFLSVSSWLLLIGSIGGTIYHGLRKYPIFIPMDWVPILLLCLMASLWFWTKVFGNPILGTAILIVLFLIQYPVNKLYEGRYSHLVMNLNYALMALVVIVPLILYLIKIKFNHSRWVYGAIISFVAALFFRISDGWGWLPVGTHFLWHAFGVSATAFMFLFIYKLNEGLTEYSRSHAETVEA
jgi:hypothetical protein